MGDVFSFGRREYEIAPALPGGRVLRCRDCGRVIAAGYPFVMERREATHAEPTHEGAPISDTVCVYCDPIAPFEAPTA